MTKNRTIQLYRGTTAQNNAYTGAIGELTMDTEKKQLRIHDGSTAGGKVVGDNVAWGSIGGSLSNQTDLADELLNLVVMLSRKVDKGHQVVAFQAPTAQNNYTWYRKYADGWVEQGGIYNTSALTYLIPMADTNYIMFLQPMDTSGKYAMNCQSLTTTGASINSEASQWHNYSWQVSGMAAS